MLSCTTTLNGTKFELRYEVDDEGRCELADIEIGSQHVWSDLLAASVLADLQRAIEADLLERRELAAEQAAQADMWAGAV